MMMKEDVKNKLKISKKRIGKITSFFLVLSLLFTCTGCESAKSDEEILEENKNTIVMTLNDYDVTMSEFNLYLIQYLKMQNLKPEDITDEKETEIINTVVEEIRLEIVEYLLAQVTDGVTVADEDLANLDTNTDNFYNSYGEEFLKSCGVDKDAVKQLLTEQLYINAMIEKAKADMAQDRRDEYAKEYEDKNFHVVYYALFPKTKEEDGNDVDLSDDELEEQKKKADELCKRAKQGEVLEDLIQEYDIADYSGEQKNFDGAYTDTQLNELIESLEEGEISEVVDLEAGYMIVRMDNKNDEEYKEAAFQYNALQDANNMITSMQSNWVSASGLTDVTPSADVIAEIDVKKMIESMIKSGLLEE